MQIDQIFHLIFKSANASNSSKKEKIAKKHHIVYIPTPFRASTMALCCSFVPIRFLAAVLFLSSVVVNFFTRININLAILDMTEGADEVCGLEAERGATKV